MRTIPTLVLASLALAAVACADNENDCKRNGECLTGSGGDASSSSTASSGLPSSSQSASTGEGGSPTSTSTGTSSSDGGGGSGGSGDGGGGAGGIGEGGGGAGPGCAPAEGEPLGEVCGIYVDASAPAGGEGTQGSPVATLDEALAAAEARGESHIYVCAGAYVGGQTIAGGTALLGGYECDWTRAEATRPTITVEAGAAGGPPATLTINGAGSTRIEDLDVVATLAPATPGASAIGILAIDADVAVARVDIDVDGGGNGAAGDTPSGGDLNGVSPQLGGEAGCASGAAVEGGDGGSKTCGGAAESVGGRGGDGTRFGGLASDGDPGSAEPFPSGATDNAGDGEPAAGACANGGEGVPGNAGTPATSLAPSLGSLTSRGLATVPGGAGVAAGTPGQGGGGGGGARGEDQCAPNAGPSGGGGGSGGCGGAVGSGGQAGGSSIGIALVRTSLTIDAAAITVGDAGNGGSGSPGQQGGQGATGALPGGGNACSGGQGGRGGWGGAGGGGSGGHSIAIAYVDAASAPGVGDDVVFDVGTDGAPGAGGDGPDDPLNGNSPSNVGPDGNVGVRCAVLQFGVDPGDACEVVAP